MEIDHIHFYVDDAFPSQQRLVHEMGWTALLQTVLPDRRLEIFAYLGCYFLFSSPHSSSGPVADYLQAHSSGVVDIAFRITNVISLFDRLCLLKDLAGLGSSTIISQSDQVSSAIYSRLASVRSQPQLGDWFRVSGWGVLRHTMFFSPQSTCESFQQTNVEAIDHIVLNVPKGELDAAAAYYQHLLDFQQEQHFKIDTNNSGLVSRVLSDRSKQIYININEPTTTNSQIQMFIDSNRGAGVQHIALKCSPIVSVVAQLRNHGLNFLPVPFTYFASLQHSLYSAKEFNLLASEEWNKIVDQQILVDCQLEKPGSLLLQIFTLPILPDSLFFFEFIERRGCAEGFGSRNFRALFEAIEEDLKIYS